MASLSQELNEIDSTAYSDSNSDLQNLSLPVENSDTNELSNSIQHPTQASSHDEPDTILSYLHHLSYAPDDDPFGEKRRPVLTTDLSDARQQLVEACVDHVFNALPTHLLRIADMTIVTRNEIWDAARSRVQTVSNNELRELRYEYSKTLGWHWTGFLEHSWCEGYAHDLFKFAIFSHRWGEREPLFHDMLSLARHDSKSILPSGPGYDKLRHLCDKAQTEFGCQYVWSDTCCINKESSSELEEAIRSMYRWYSLAKVCIVHLAHSTTVDDFGLEPWFTRGWTLQELLAPKFMRFYGKDWNPISPELPERGDKANTAITTAITKVTGIPAVDLQHFHPSCELIAPIMTWSSKRKTTRVEDRAYALLGLFNVSIPIAYGEGHKAFYRLMVALSNECTTPAFFAWAGRHSEFSNALPSSPACYDRVSDGDGHGSDSGSRPEEMTMTMTPTEIIVNTLAGHPAYQFTKLGVEVQLLVFRVYRNLTLRGGFHVGTTWYFDQNVPLEPFMIRAGTGAALPPSVSTEAEDDHEYALGVVNFVARPGAPDGNLVHGELVCGEKYFGILLRKSKWGWEKLTSDRVIALSCREDVKGQLKRILLLHTAFGSLY